MVGQPGQPAILKILKRVSSDPATRRRAAALPQEPNDGGVLHDLGLRKWTLEEMRGSQKGPRCPY